MDAPRSVILGANGFLGPALAARLMAAGFAVTTVTRHDRPVLEGAAHARWDGKGQGDWAGHLDGAAAVINLAGKSIDCRHTPENLAVIRSSRVDSTTAVAEAIAACEVPPATWLNASTAAIYRPRVEDQPPATEDDPPEAGEELREVGIAWEDALLAPDLPATRRIAMRISVVLGEGGALPVLRRLTRWGLGGKAGSGRQWMSWITVEDLCTAVLHLIEHEEVSGPVNFAAPGALTNRDFMAAMRRVMKRPIGLPAPAFGIRLGARLVGTEAKLVLESMKVAPQRLLASGFAFADPELEPALEKLLRVS
jgi:uncharacterized protein (TIGR01777 family)